MVEKQLLAKLRDTTLDSNGELFRDHTVLKYFGRCKTVTSIAAFRKATESYSGKGRGMLKTSAANELQKRERLRDILFTIIEGKTNLFE